MKKILLSLLVLSSSAWAAPSLTVQNRILARVDGKAVSVRDITQSLDQSFDHNYPQYLNNPEARQQYYVNSWKTILEDLVTRQLILSDAEERKLPVPHADVREEMEQAFGPNMLSTLDDQGLTFDEAWRLIKEEIALRRMLMIRVNSRAINTVGPAAVRHAFEGYCCENEGKESWTYRVLSVRGDDHERAALVAAAVYEKASKSNGTLEELTEELAEEGVTLSLSKPIERTRSTISDTHWEGINGLEPETISPPLMQLSRQGDRLFRIYAVDAQTTPDLPQFSDVENKFHERLVQEAVEKEREVYMAELREKFEVESLYSLDGSGEELFLLN